MSHVDTMELVCTSISAAEKMAKEFGGVLKKASTYRWFGRHVGDYPLPKGFGIADMGQCEYKITFPDCSYEVGLAKNPNGSGYVIVYDFFDNKLSEKIGGPKALKLQASLMKHQTIEAAEKRGLKWKEVKKEGKLVIRTFLK